MNGNIALPSSAFQPQTKWGEIMYGVAEIVRAVKYPGVRAEIGWDVSTSGSNQVSWVVYFAALAFIIYLLKRGK